MSDAMLTIVIPTYQRQAELQRALDSLHQPGHERIEVVISDNASSDETEPYVRAVQLPFAKNYLRNSENIGICHNLYQAAKAVQTPYQMWMTDDDYLMDGGLMKLLRAIEKNPDCGYLYSHVHSIGDFCPVDDVRNLMGPSTASFRTEPSIEAVARYVRYGWVYSRQTYKTEVIDWPFWQKNILNAYSCALMAGRTMIQQPTFYQSESIVAHTIGNECHWEEFGKDKLHIRLRTDADFRHCLAAIFDDLPETPEIRLAIDQWERGCEEACFHSLRETIAAIPIATAYRALRSGYRVSPMVARRMIKRSRNPLVHKYHRLRGKEIWRKHVQVNDLM